MEIAASSVHKKSEKLVYQIFCSYILVDLRFLISLHNRKVRISTTQSDWFYSMKNVYLYYTKLVTKCSFISDITTAAYQKHIPLYASRNFVMAVIEIYHCTAINGIVLHNFTISMQFDVYTTTLISSSLVLFNAYSNPCPY